MAAHTIKALLFPASNTNGYERVDVEERGKRAPSDGLARLGWNAMFDREGKAKGLLENVMGQRVLTHLGFTNVFPEPGVYGDLLLVKTSNVLLDEIDITAEDIAYIDAALATKEHVPATQREGEDAPVALTPEMMSGITPTDQPDAPTGASHKPAALLFAASNATGYERVVIEERAQKWPCFSVSRTVGSGDAAVSSGWNVYYDRAGKANGLRKNAMGRHVLALIGITDLAGVYGDMLLVRTGKDSSDEVDITPEDMEDVNAALKVVMARDTDQGPRRPAAWVVSPPTHTVELIVKNREREDEPAAKKPRFEEAPQEQAHE